MLTYKLSRRPNHKTSELYMKRKLLLFILISCFILGFASAILARDLVIGNHTDFTPPELYSTSDYRHG